MTDTDSSAAPIRIGEAPAALSRQLGLTDDDIAALEALRDRSPAEPMTFD